MREHRGFQTVFNAEGYFETPTIKINDALKKHHGRPSKQISEQELKEIFKGILNPNPAERQQIRQQYTEQKIKHAINIYKTDFGKQGVIFRTECPFHRRQKLSYGWQGSGNGVRIKCLVPGCTALNTHFEPMLFHSEMGMILNGLSEHSDE
jgi:hypothetical protein